MYLSNISLVLGGNVAFGLPIRINRAEVIPHFIYVDFKSTKCYNYIVGGVCYEKYNCKRQSNKYYWNKR